MTEGDYAGPTEKWWSEYRPILPTQYEEFIALEAAAVRVAVDRHEVVEDRHPVVVELVGALPQLEELVKVRALRPRMDPEADLVPEDLHRLRRIG